MNTSKAREQPPVLRDHEERTNRTVTPRPAGTTAAPSRVIVGRQAILDRAHTTIGYELLFRPANPDDENPTGDEATAEVLFGAMSMGLSHLVGDKMLFCNADRGALLGTVPICLPPERTVVEILETVEPDAAILAGCAKLASQGYTLALDDFQWIDGAPGLLELATIVKIDIQQVNGRHLDILLAQCRPYGVTLLAEKIETDDELNLCRDLGFDLFQGYLFERPAIIAGRAVESSALSRMRLATSILSPDLDIDDLETTLRADPGLSYQIMQIASLGRLGESRRDINTIREALVLCGTQRIRNWIALLLARPPHTIDRENFTNTLVRARACELLAGRFDSQHASVGFAAGLLSSLDQLFGIPAAELRAMIPIGGRLADAAFGNQTDLAHLVRDAIDYQQSVPERQPNSDLTEGDLDHAFAHAVRWAIDVLTELDL